MTMTGVRKPRVPRAAVRRRSGLVMAAVRPIAARAANSSGVVLWDVEFVREAGIDTLRVSVDREGGIDSSALTAFAEKLSRELDAADAVPGDGRYLLEAASPGAERKLRGAEQFRVCRGRLARLTFRSGREPVEGVIADATDETVTLDVAGERIEIELGDISQARLKVPGA